jgi:uncharacterized protein YyaL (SSP411 family)
MPNRLADAVSPYLRSHASNPVDWQQWGAEPFAEAARRQVPVLISIGYSSCHWCHVMARESFSDPVLAEYLNANFVSIKVDREEYPDVDSTYMASAGAFTQELGWPLTVFATPDGKTFFAGTYFPPTPMQGRASFRQVLEAVLDAWTDRRTEVESNATQIAAALTSQGRQRPGVLPTEPDFAAIVSELASYEDTEFSGFGGAPKFPVATVLGFLLDREGAGDDAAGAIARRTLTAMADSELRDPVEGGFFRYAVQRNWSEPHYERMLYDNALLLSAYARIDRADIAEGIASFLLGVLRLPSGGFASAQDSESTVDGVRVEGGYYALDADRRAQQVPPALDDKVLTGWNGLAIEALAYAGERLGRPDWIQAARETADYLTDDYFGDGQATLVRARIGLRVSDARATLEDYGMLASGLLQVALATGESHYAERARALVTETMASAAASLAPASSTASDVPISSPVPFAVPGGADPVLTAHGLALEVDPSEGAYPSGLSAIASAAHRLHLLTGETAFVDAAAAAMELLAPLAVQRPISFGAALTLMSALDAPVRQLVVVTGSQPSPVAAVARAWQRPGAIVSVVSEEQAQTLATAGFELFDGRSTRDGITAAYFCENFLCRLPVTEADQLTGLLV